MVSATAIYSTTAPKAPVDYSFPPHFVPSSKNPNQFHLVARTVAGCLRCDCRASDFPKTAGRCRHLKDVRAGKVKPAAWKRPAPPAPVVDLARLGIADQSRPVSVDDLF